MCTEQDLAQEELLENNEYHRWEANGCPIRDYFDEDYFDDIMDNEEDI